MVHPLLNYLVADVQVVELTRSHQSNSLIYADGNHCFRQQQAAVSCAGYVEYSALEILLCVEFHIQEFGRHLFIVSLHTIYFRLLKFELLICIPRLHIQEEFAPLTLDNIQM